MGDKEFHGRTGDDAALESATALRRIDTDVHLHGATGKAVAPTDSRESHLEEGGHPEQEPSIAVADPDPLTGAGKQAHGFARVAQESVEGRVSAAEQRVEDARGEAGSGHLVRPGIDPFPGAEDGGVRPRYGRFLRARDDMAGVVAGEKGPELPSLRALDDVPCRGKPDFQFLLADGLAVEHAWLVKDRKRGIGRYGKGGRDRRASLQPFQSFQPLQALRGGGFGKVQREDADETATGNTARRNQDRPRSERNVGGLPLTHSRQGGSPLPQERGEDRGTLDGAAEDVLGIGGEFIAPLETGLQENRIDAVHREILAACDDFSEGGVIECPVVDVLARVGLVDSCSARRGETDIEPLEGPPRHRLATVVPEGNFQRPGTARGIDRQRRENREIILLGFPESPVPLRRERGARSRTDHGNDHAALIPLHLDIKTMQASRKRASEHQVDQEVGPMAHGMETACGMKAEMQAVGISHPEHRECCMVSKGARASGMCRLVRAHGLGCSSWDFLLAFRISLIS